MYKNWGDQDDYSDEITEMTKVSGMTGIDRMTEITKVTGMSGIIG